MRITGGHAKGRVLRAPVQDGVRPTASRVREALFSIIGQDLTGQAVLDAFGGSGLLGLEAWSRGATVVIVERHPGVARQIRAEVAGLDAADAVRVEVGDVLRRAPDLGAVDGVLADPPYALEPGPVLSALAPLAREWLVFETERSRRLPEAVAHLALTRHRDFGGTALWVYRSVA